MSLMPLSMTRTSSGYTLLLLRNLHSTEGECLRTRTREALLLTEQMMNSLDILRGEGVLTK